ncbi:NAD(P)-dependent alcohol dehydrogenase [Photorhabdus bodei]|uniref:Alcohol dehydrogenase catalytic domain-containing protein n=1 Tax=Photorhabdus bodei TaxID=2029681 RepID=A0A329X1W7_9GAMM|nr:NAD(P)-dependent alcohol dehydrogenase [Photorhabdus bodei]NDK98250.1 alcohol dehydrogenase catalytic domain-containing protein [Photorhabdus bodei]NDL02501.1 alcohol dehydrogenase catalytic domain-containing protein [Photorhabdus bodei]NDL06575.1 alcohol dehydrogenase catalytic domain-containing protein [Photorhabdus bodei]RAX10355.1 NAD(P)-dependent alcohol dehydrogenase [Photorhabdus bodei]
MKALVLEKAGQISIQDWEASEILGENDVEIKIHSVGICGSDVHYYQYGRIGPFVVEKPMILGHEASGVITAVGKNVTHLKIGDRVCMEPGIPNLQSPQSRAGIYNLDPEIRFWATPPIDGCLRERVIHPAAFTFKLPDNVNFAEGAMVEPLAIGMQAATKAEIKPGDIALVVGAGTIGIVTALAALAGGCSDVIICDVFDEKLEIAKQYPGLHPVNNKVLAEKVNTLTDGNGVNILFECSGAKPVITTISEHIAPGGIAVLVGMPIDPAPFDIVSAQAKEITFKTIFRYANMYPRTIRLLSSGKLKVTPLLSATYKFKDSVQAYERAAEGHPTDIKIMLEME